jgi:hypothetical protein
MPIATIAIAMQPRKRITASFFTEDPWTSRHPSRKNEERRRPESAGRHIGSQARSSATPQAGSCCEPPATDKAS